MKKRRQRTPSTSKRMQRFKKTRKIKSKTGTQYLPRINYDSHRGGGFFTNAMKGVKNGVKKLFKSKTAKNLLKKVKNELKKPKTQRMMVNTATDLIDKLGGDGKTDVNFEKKIKKIKKINKKRYYRQPTNNMSSLIMSPRMNGYGGYGYGSQWPGIVI